jgi:hypothetical protein
LVVCTDDAINALVRKFREELGLAADEIKHAGGPKSLAEEGTRRAIAIEDIGLSVEKHGVTRIILAAHENCGKYGGSAHFAVRGINEKAFHAGELAKAKEVVQNLLPNVTVELYYLRVDQSWEKLG